MRKMIDLFSGLGGASEAMIDCPGWEVIRIDNNPLLSGVPKTVIRDINKLTPNQTDDSIELVWASPPCREFSNGFSSPKSIAHRAGIEFKPDMSLVNRAIQLINEIEPKYWVIENVVGAIKEFSKILGPPRQIIGPYVLWGNFPTLTNVQVATKKSTDVHSANPLRSNIRAKVDLSLSQALKSSIENQKSITDFM